jgi:sec-independent protein translocase protein TatA
MGFLSEPTHWMLILVLLLVIFGAKRLPELGKGLGEGLKGFREGMKGVTDPAPAQPVQQAVNALPQSGASIGGKANYRCPNCKNVLSANAPNPNVPDEKGFCPECGSQFDKKSAAL